MFEKLDHVLEECKLFECTRGKDDRAPTEVLGQSANYPVLAA